MTARLKESVCILAVCLCAAIPVFAQQVAAVSPHPGTISGGEIAAPDPQPGNIVGTVIDTNDDIVPGATVELEGSTLGEDRKIVAKDDGSFIFDSLRPGIPYRVTISADGFVSWTSPALVLNPGQYLFLKDSRIAISGGTTSVTVYSSSEQIAVEQVKFEEQQRVLGVIPNFFVSYNHDAAPLTKRLKFSLSFRAATDPVTLLGMGLLAASNQAANRLDYGQGAQGYGQRLGAAYADGFTNIMLGGAILRIAPAPGPSLLLSGHRYKEVSRPACDLQPLHLQGRQRTVAAKHFEHRRRFGYRRYLEYLLPGDKSRARASV